MPNQIDQNREEKLKLIETVRQAIQHDNELREKYEIGEKFRFVRDRLNTILETLETSLPKSTQGSAFSDRGVAADEVPVYVYLYNTQGLQFRTWQNLVSPKVFYEYSVNRPIYMEKAQIESLLKTKTNKAQHAYLAIAVKRDHIINVPEDGAQKDAIGNQLVKVKEGSLHIGKLIAFTHQGQDYVLDDDGQLVKKSGNC